jgi:phosphopantothenoylcysteine decarboxylase/phosphopantothenate--cysteine ligase
MKIVVAVTGSIAAYKAAELVRMLVKSGDEVHVVMTPAACEFVRPLTFQTLSRNPVEVESFARVENWVPEHISLAQSADLVVVAPATANTIAKMRGGIADNLLTSVLLAVKAPVLVAPAMNTGMWESPVTQENIRELSARGVTVIEPEDGELACGVKGKGRMMNPEDIFKAVAAIGGRR